MKTLLTVMLCSQFAFAQSADAPVVDPPIEGLSPPGRVLELAAGELVPFDATCLDKSQASRTAKLKAFYEGEAVNLKKGNVIVPTPAFIAVVAGTAIAAIIAGGAIVYAAVPHGPPR